MAFKELLGQHDTGCSSSSTEAQDQVERRLFLDVIVGKCVTVFQLFACENQALLVRRDTLLVLNLCLDVVDGVACLNVEGDGFACQGLHKDLHASAQAQDQMERRLLLDIVVRKCATVFQLFACENQALLVRRDTLLILNLCLDVVDGVACLNVEG